MKCPAVQVFAISALQTISARQLTRYTVLPALIPMGRVTAGGAQAVTVKELTIATTRASPTNLTCAAFRSQGILI